MLWLFNPRAWLALYHAWRKACHGGYITQLGDEFTAWLDGMCELSWEAIQRKVA